MSMKNSKPLIIGLVLDDSLDSTDGVQQYVITLGAWLTSQGHNVHYITSETKRTDLPQLHVLSKRLKTRFNGNSGGSPLPAHPRAVKKLLHDIDFDVLHIQVPYSPFLAGQLITKASPKTAIIGTFHIFPESKLVTIATRGLGLWVSRQLRRFDTMLSVSTAAQEFSKLTYRIDSTVVPNMIDVSRFLVPAENNSKKLEIVFLGRLVERKGALQLLEAINFIQQNKLVDVPFHVTIGGKGLLREKLETYVQHNDLGNVVTFSGFVAEEDKAKFLAKGDIAVFPSTGGESFGISLLEALAATPGPVLAGNNAGYRTVMGPFTKQLFDPNNTKDFAKLLVEHMHNRKGRRDIHSEQVAYVKQFDTEVVARQILASYRDALQRRQQ
jgi:phosphatidyl-myo-inositol alpha-mannosyltransferase